MDDSLDMHDAHRAESSWGSRYDRLRMMRVGWAHAPTPQSLAAIPPQPTIAKLITFPLFFAAIFSSFRFYVDCAGNILQWIPQLK